MKHIFDPGLYQFEHQQPSCGEARADKVYSLAPVFSVTRFFQCPGCHRDEKEAWNF
jgi:hypothetical protein